MSRNGAIYFFSLTRYSHPRDKNQIWEIKIRLFIVKGPCKRTQHCWPTTRNIVGPTCCVRLHGTTIMLSLVAYSLKPLELLGTCKRTQHCWPKTHNNTQQCCDLLRPFAWALSSKLSYSALFVGTTLPNRIPYLMKLSLILLKLANASSRCPGSIISFPNE